MLNFIYYPVSAILWFWHNIFGYLLGPDNGFAWALSVIFLVFSIRILLFKPFVSQVRSMRKMQEFAPQIQKLKEKYGNDRQKMSAEMQKLQSEQGVNPLGGCLPILAQIPVFIGLFHVLRMFNRPFLSPEENRQIGNYVFSAEDVRSFLDARLFGAPLSARIADSAEVLARYGDVTRMDMIMVTVPLMIVAGVATHFTSRLSVARQNPIQAANPQTAIMNKVTLYLFPIGVVVGGPWFPLAILLYWLSNNTWTLGQQFVVYRKIDAEEAAKKEAETAQKQSLAPKPGQKPTRPKKSASSQSSDAGQAGKATDAGGTGAAGTEAAGTGTAGTDAAGATEATGSDDAGSTGSSAGTASSDGGNGARPAKSDSSSEVPGLVQPGARKKKKGNRKRR